MKRFLYILGFLACTPLFLLAQDDAIFMHYTISPILVNPAAAGFSENYQLQLNTRAQWTGFEDAPNTIQARFNGPLGRTFGIGVGIVSEKAAQLTRTKLHLDYAFRHTFKDDWKLAFGFFTEFQNLKVDGDITSSPLYDPADQTLEDVLNGDGEFEASIGFLGTYRDNTYGGLTINNLVTSRLSNIAGVSESEPIFSYYTFNLGHKIQLTQHKVTLEPSIMLRQLRNAPFQMDLNMKAGFLDDQLVAVLSYRSLGALGILLGTKLKNFHLYYSYDVSFQRFQKFNTGSHEITIAMNFRKKTEAEKKQQNK